MGTRLDTVVNRVPLSLLIEHICQAVRVAIDDDGEHGTASRSAMVHDASGWSLFTVCGGRKLALLA